MPKLFISYSRTDEVFARQLATSLSGMGADIWIDIRDIPAGLKWSSAIQEGLDRCDAMILIISPASMASQNVEDEWQHYRDRGKVIVPVMIQPSQLHYQLGRLQYISFHTQPYNVALTQLHSELYRKGIMLNAPPNAVTAPVPRAPAGYAAPPQSNASSGVRPTPAAKRGGNNLLTLGCIGLIVVGVVLGGGALLAGNFFSPTTLSASAQTATSIVATNNAVGTEAGATRTALAGTPAPQHGIVRVIAESVRLRSGPGTNFDQVGEALQGATFEILAQAPSSTGTGEVWFLIDRANGGPAWVSSVAVEVTPPNAVPPTAVTLPPTPTVATTATATPSATPTATSAPSVDSATDVIQASISVANIPYNFGFNAGRFNTLRLSVVAYPGAAMFFVVRDSSGAPIARGEGGLTVQIAPNTDFTIEVTDTSGGTGNFNLQIERSVQG